jgi:hypothetical protein
MLDKLSGFSCKEQSIDVERTAAVLTIKTAFLRASSKLHCKGESDHLLVVIMIYNINDRTYRQCNQFVALIIRG